MSDEPVNWDAHARMDGWLRDFMQLHGRPPSRGEYVDLIWGPDKPAEWTAEHEAALPEPLQRPVGHPERD